LGAADDRDPGDENDKNSRAALQEECIDAIMLRGVSGMIVRVPKQTDAARNAMHIIAITTNIQGRARNGLVAQEIFSTTESRTAGRKI